MSQSRKTSEVEEFDFKWGKKKGIGGKKKEVQFYESFTYDGIEYSLYDNVYLHKEDEPEPYIGKLVKIWEQPQEKKKVKILWFFRPIEILNFLEDDITLENELFLATGDGQGLANINPLEAIAGKCHVVCTSKDSRNPQPSPEELRKADYVFYRTFDVGTCAISEKIDDKIVGVEVRFLLNRDLGQQSSDVPVEKEENGNVTDTNGVSKLSPELEISMPGALVDEVVDDKTGHSLKKNDEHLNISVNQDPLSVEGIASDLGAVTTKTEVLSVLREPVPSHKKKLSRLSTGSCNDEVDTDTPISKNEDKNLKSSKDLGLDDRPAKKAKIDAPVNLTVKPITSPTLASNDDKNGSILQKEEIACNNDMPQVSGTVVSTCDAEKKSKPLKDLPRLDKGSLKKAKPDEKLSNATLPKTKAVNAAEENVISKGQLMDVTRRPDTDRSKWFKELPWEERIHDAHEKGTLVLLENLDPTYSSTEIEDIIWSGFRESCTAKVVPQTAVSSPHSGQASVIFKSKDAADTAVRKLNDGCLMLPNGRPLMASYGTPPSLPGNPSTYLGHLDIDKKKAQMLRAEQREAVSTSHYSQPNTIEYEMAMEWCLLQKVSESMWTKLYKRQGDTLEKLKAKLKSKFI